MTVHRVGVKVAGQQKIVVVDQSTQLVFKAVSVSQISQAQPQPRGLVFIGRANTAPGGAYGIFSARFFARLVKRFVKTQNGRTEIGRASCRERVSKCAGDV